MVDGSILSVATFTFYILRAIDIALSVLLVRLGRFGVRING